MEGVKVCVFVRIFKDERLAKDLRLVWQRDTVIQARCES
jgi:hypothetical protein